MSVIFNADEIFDIAIQIEQNGEKFYKDVAEKTKIPELKARLLDLAEMENEHKQTFSALKKDIFTKEKEPITFDPNNELALYLNAFARGHVFDLDQDPVKTINNINSIEEILKKAIELEKDSIVFYLGIKELVPVNLGKNQIDRIITQEMEHISLLSDELKSVS